MISVYEEKQLKNFFIACDEMIQGKFILSDVKITRILKAITESKILYDLITKCLINFNFEKEFRDAKTNNRVNGGYFKMPSEEYKIIALMFVFLLEVNNGKINLQNFIAENFFSQDGYNVSYNNFSIVMLMPFKAAVMKELNCNEEGKILKTESEHLQELEEKQIKIEEIMVPENLSAKSERKLKFANLRISLGKLGNAIKVSKKLKLDKKEELMIVINAMLDCIKDENLKLINALVIAFEYAFKNNRELKVLYKNFLNHLISLLYE